MQMGVGLFVSGVIGSAQPAISIVAAPTAAGQSLGAITGVMPGDDAIIILRKSASTSAPNAPSGNPFNYTTLVTATGAANCGRMFHTKITAAMLTGDSFTPGTFTNATGTRSFGFILRNVNSLTAAVSATVGATTTLRPFSAITGLNARGLIIGKVWLSSGTPPVPAGATITNDQTSSGRTWAAAASSWTPAAGTAGSDLDWLEMAVGAI